MEKKNALAFKKFVIEAEQALHLIMKEKDALDKKELERLKDVYNAEKNLEMLIAVEDEIFANYDKYDRNIELVKTYLSIVFSDVARHDSVGDERITHIIEGDFEIEYLLKLDKALKENFDIINLYAQQDPSISEDELLDYVKRVYVNCKTITDVDYYTNSVDADGIFIPNWRFDFKNLKKELEDSKMSGAEKIEFVNNRLLDFLQWQQQYDFICNDVLYERHSKYKLTNQYYPKFEKLCRLELARLEVLNVKVEAPPKPLPKAPVVVRSASKRKTDIIKIISAMYDNRMFANAEGKPHTNKQAVMEAFGEFFGEDFTAYSTLLSQAKDKPTDVFLKVFDDIKRSAKQYHEN